MNRLCGEMLQLIGTRTNERFGNAAENQHKFFSRPSERETFPVHLLISMFEETKGRLEAQSKTYEKKIRSNGDKARPFSKDNFKGISAAKKVRFGATGLTKTEVRAVGVLYMLSLIWTAANELSKNDAPLKRSISDLVPALKMASDLFVLLDETEKLQSNSSAGKKGDKKRQFADELSLVEDFVRRYSDLSTAITVKRLRKLIPDNPPSDRWLLDNVRRLKRKST